MKLSELQQKLKQLTDKVERLENKLEIYTNPATVMSDEEQVKLIVAAIKTGDKKELRAVTRFINGE
ncbi:MAG: hypothetical protein WBB19_19920 [Desulforhopalus sp.]